MSSSRKSSCCVLSIFPFLLAFAIFRGCPPHLFSRGHAIGTAVSVVAAPRATLRVSPEYVGYPLQLHDFFASALPAFGPGGGGKKEELPSGRPKGGAGAMSPLAPCGESVIEREESISKVMYNTRTLKGCRLQAERNTAFDLAPYLPVDASLSSSPFFDEASCNRNFLRCGSGLSEDAPSCWSFFQNCSALGKQLLGPMATTTSTAQGGLKGLAFVANVGGKAQIAEMVSRSCTEMTEEKGFFITGTKNTLKTAQLTIQGSAECQKLAYRYVSPPTLRTGRAGGDIDAAAMLATTLVRKLFFVSNPLIECHGCDIAGLINFCMYLQVERLVVKGDYDDEGDLCIFDVSRL